MSKLEELRKEEAELEKLMYGGAEEKPTETVAPSTGDEGDEGTIEVLETPTNTETPEAKKRVSWKKRHASYKTATDHTIYTLRQENAALKANMANISESTDQLRKEMTEFRAKAAKDVDPFEGIITQEDSDIIGPEAVEIIKKVANVKQSNPELNDLRAELDLLKAERTKALKDEAKNIRAKSFEDLKNKLSTVVPDWVALDDEPDFKVFMEQGYDKVSGRPRMDLFHSAMSSGDVANVARFYNEYKSLKPETKESILEKKVTPVAEGGDSTASIIDRQKKTYTIDEYVNFYDDLNRGVYRGKEKEAKGLQHILDTAYVEGRLIE